MLKPRGCICFLNQPDQMSTASNAACAETILFQRKMKQLRSEGWRVGGWEE